MLSTKVENQHAAHLKPDLKVLDGFAHYMTELKELPKHPALALGFELNHDDAPVVRAECVDDVHALTSTHHN